MSKFLQTYSPQLLLVGTKFLQTCSPQLLLVDTSSRTVSQSHQHPRHRLCLCHDSVSIFSSRTVFQMSFVSIEAANIMYLDRCRISPLQNVFSISMFASLWCVISTCILLYSRLHDRPNSQNANEAFPSSIRCIAMSRKRKRGVMNLLKVFNPSVPSTFHPTKLDFQMPVVMITKTEIVMILIGGRVMTPSQGQLKVMPDDNRSLLTLSLALLMSSLRSHSQR